MRIVIIDQFDVESPSSEEGLEIAVARVGLPFDTLSAFLTARPDYPGRPSLDAGQPLDATFAGSTVRAHLRRFAGIDVPDPCSWPTHLLERDDDMHRYAVASPTHFIDYRWDCWA